MGRMIRIELYRAFHGKELKAAMLLGGLLGVAHFVLEVIPLVKHIFDGYNPYIASSVVRNVSDITTNLLLAYKDKDKARPAISPANTNISIILYRQEIWDT